MRLEPFLFPIYGIPLLHQGFYGSGIFLYDLLGAHRDGGFAKHLRPSSAIDYAPNLRRKGLTGAILYHDGVEDDARLALAVLRTALAGGAVGPRGCSTEPLLDGERIIARASRILSVMVEVRASACSTRPGRSSNRRPDRDPRGRRASSRDAAPHRYPAQSTALRRGMTLRTGSRRP